MFKLFDVKDKEKEEKFYHFHSLIEKEDYTSILEKIEEGHQMKTEEKAFFDILIDKKIQSDGIMFLSNLYKEGFEITDEWFLRWTKTNKFVTNYNLPVFGNEHFKQRLEKLAPDILSYYLFRMDNLASGVARNYKVGFIQAIEILTSVRNYAKIIEHIEVVISDKNFNEYFQKLKDLNSIVENSPLFYKEIGDQFRVSDYLKDLEVILQRREFSKKLPIKKAEPTKEFLLPYNMQDCIKRIYDNYEKCMNNKKYLRPETVEVLNKIKNEKVEILTNKFKKDEDKNYFLTELQKIDNAIASVLFGVNKQRITDTNQEYLTNNKLIRKFK